jgi:hypothetical protein
MQAETVDNPLKIKALAAASELCYQLASSEIVAGRGEREHWKSVPIARLDSLLPTRLLGFYLYFKRTWHSPHLSAK